MSIYQHVTLGARAIAVELFGDDTPRSVRRVRHQFKIGTIPVFKLGGQLALDRRDLEPWLEQRKAEAEERRAKSSADYSAKVKVKTDGTKFKPRRRGRPPKKAKLRLLEGGAK